MNYLIGVLFGLATSVGIYTLGNFFANLLFRKKDNHSIIFLTGLGFLGLFSQALLLIGYFERKYILSLILLSIVYFFYKNRKKFISNIRNGFTERFHREVSRQDRLILFIIFVIILIYGLLMLTPITTGDGLNYHLPFVRDMIVTHKLNYPVAGITTWGLGYLPAFAEIIYAAFLLIAGASTIAAPLAVLQIMLTLSLLFIVYRYSRSIIKSSTIRLLFILWFLVMPDISAMILHLGMVDLPLYVYMISALLLVLEWIQVRDADLLYKSALFLGFASSIKYTAAVTVSFCILLVLFVLLRKKELIKNWAILIRCALIIFVISGYWYIKNLVMFFNPIYPLFSDAGLVNSFKYVNPYPRTWWIFVAYPFLVQQHVFFVDNPSRLKIIEGVSTATAFIGAAILFIKEGMSNVRAQRVVLLLVSVIFYSWIAFFVSDDIRYHLQPLIILGLIGAVVFDWSFEMFGWLINRRIIVTMVGCAAVIFLINLRAYDTRITLIAGRITQQEYILDEIKSSYAFEHQQKMTRFMER